MKEQIIFIAISFLACNLYCEYVKRKYGRKSSISATAKYAPRWLFFAFTGLSFLPLMFLAQSSYISIFSIGLLTCIGVITGVNPDLKRDRDKEEENLKKGIKVEIIERDKLQDAIHVGLTIGCICGYALGMIFINRWFLIPIFYCAWISLILWAGKIRHHTWIIERILFYFVHSSWLVYYLIKIL